jgi:hypothetical protein
MEDYNLNDSALNTNVMILLNRTLDELTRLKLDRITDFTLCRNYDYLIGGIESVKLLITDNPRFNWVTVQKDIDDLYASDPNLTCIDVRFIFKEGAAKTGLLKYQIKKTK